DTAPDVNGRSFRRLLLQRVVPCRKLREPGQPLNSGVAGVAGLVDRHATQTDLHTVGQGAGRTAGVDEVEIELALEARIAGELAHLDGDRSRFRRLDVVQHHHGRLLTDVDGHLDLGPRPLLRQDVDTRLKRQV